MREPAFWHRPPSLLSLLLMPLGALYGVVTTQRMQGEGLEAGIPVICVGNYHVGGAGKTPAVLALTKLLRDLGETPVVLSRGYGGRLRGPVRVDPARHRADDVGDEPLMLARTVPVMVARDRTDGVALAKSQGATVILMDDGFQNPSIAKDACLIVIDGDRGLGNGRVFPAGPLRAPLSPQLARTDALIVIGDGSAAAPVAEKELDRLLEGALEDLSVKDAAAAVSILAEAKVRVLPVGSALRFITHRDLSEADVLEAIQRIQPITDRLVTTWEGVRPMI